MSVPPSSTITRRTTAGADLGALRVSVAALRRLWQHRRAVLLAYLLLLGPAYLLGWSDLLPSWDGAGSPFAAASAELGALDLVSSLLFTLLTLLLDAAVILLFTGSAAARAAGDGGQEAKAPCWRRSARWLRLLAAAFFALLLVWMLRSLVMGLVLLSVVLVLPVLAWFSLAEVIAVHERENNPLDCLHRSKRRVSGRTLEVLICLMICGLPLLAGSLATWHFGPYPPFTLPHLLSQLANVLLDLLGIAYTAVTVELYFRLRPGN